MWRLSEGSAPSTWNDVKLGSSDTFRSIIEPRMPLAIEWENIIQTQQLEIQVVVLVSCTNNPSW